MPEFVKKTLINYSKVEDGRSDPNCSHAIMTIDEYNGLLQKIKNAEDNVRIIEADSEKTIEKIKREADSHVYAAQETARKSIEATEQELAKAQAEIDYQKKLNENLLRISKERANADRKIKPKKTHHGYLIVYSKEYEYRYRTSSKHEKKVMLWETIIESPYSVKFTDEQARKQMDLELFGSGEWLIGKVGINARWLIGYENLINEDDYKNDLINKNVVVRSQLRGNYKNGYWEIVLLHTKPLVDVPDDMCPCYVRKGSSVR